MTKFRKFGALLLAAALLTGTAACSGGSGSSSAPAADNNNTAATTPDAGTPAPDAAAPAASGDKKVVTFFHRWPNEPKNPIFTAYVNDFMAANSDIEIQMDCVLNDSYKEKVRVLVSGNSVPDVFSS